MSKVRLPIMVLCVSLCAAGSYAQEQKALTLEQIFALADENSKVLKIEDAAVSVAQQGVKVARNGYLPDIDISLSGSYLGNGCLTDRDFSNGQNIKMPHWGNNFAVQASQLIYGGGAVSNNIAMAKLQEDMAGVNREAARSRIRFMLTGFYLDLYKLQNVLKVYEQNIDLVKVVLEDTKTRSSAGVALKNDITRHELQLKQLVLAQSKVENSAQILNYNLATMLNLPSNTYILPDSTLIERSLPVEDIAYWQSIASTNAYGVKQTEISINMSEKGEALARAQRRPSIALIAANHFDGPITIEVPVIDKNFNYWYVGIGVSFKLSSLYKSGKNVRQAQYRTLQSRNALDNALEQTSMEVYSNYTGYLESYDQVTVLEKSVSLAKENYSIIENRYRNGMALATEMIDASNQLLDAQLQLANARINVIFNYYKLKNITGNL